MRAEAFNIPAALADRIEIKRFADLQAHLAWIHGVCLSAIEGDDGEPLYVASAGALTRRFKCLEEIESWSRRLDDEGTPRGEIARFIGALEVAG